MPYLIAVFAGLSAALVATSLLQIWWAPARVVSKEVAQLSEAGPGPFEAGRRRHRRDRRRRLQRMVAGIGLRIDERRSEPEGLRRRLEQAGYWNPEAVRYYLGVRVQFGHNWLTNAPGFNGTVTWQDDTVFRMEPSSG